MKTCAYCAETIAPDAMFCGAACANNYRRHQERLAAAEKKQELEPVDALVAQLERPINYGATTCSYPGCRSKVPVRGRQHSCIRHME